MSQADGRQAHPTWVIDAYRVAQDAGMGRRINTVMQTCFFAISGILPQHEAIAAIKHAVEDLRQGGRRIAELNYRAIDKTLACLHEVSLPEPRRRRPRRRRAARRASSSFIQASPPLIAGKGDALPVSLFPPTAPGRPVPPNTKAQPRLEIPVIGSPAVHQCGKCVFVCPHAAIRQGLPGRTGPRRPRPSSTMAIRSKDYPAGWKMTARWRPRTAPAAAVRGHLPDPRQVERLAQGHQHGRRRRRCGAPRRKLGLLPHPAGLRPQARQARHGAGFDAAGAAVRVLRRLRRLRRDALYPPATQLFGDRMMVANATGCSSIYGGNLPTTPHTTNAEGGGRRGATRCSRTTPSSASACAFATDQLALARARVRLRELAPQVGEELVTRCSMPSRAARPASTSSGNAWPSSRPPGGARHPPAAEALATLADHLVRRSVWIIGGDGWAYDIGFGGLDHVLASGET